MARQPLWDKYEVALLIEAYLRIDQKTESRQRVVAETSQLLRERAVYLGIDIDDIYRNENGIKMRMSTMQYLFTEGRKGIPNDSKLFAEIFNLYNNDRASFKRILKIAHSQTNTEDVPYTQPGVTNMIAENITTKETIVDTMDKEKCKADFIQWLQGRTKLKASIGKIIFVQDECDAYANKHNISEQSFWNISEPSEYLAKAKKLLQTHLFRVMHRKAALTYDKTHLYFYEYLVYCQQSMAATTTAPRMAVSTENSGHFVDDHADGDNNFSEFVEWMQTRDDMSERTCYAYASNLRSLRVFCCVNNITEKDFSAYTSDELLSVCELILVNDKFKKYNAEQHNRFSAALKKYVEFKTGKQVIIPRKPTLKAQKHNNIESSIMEVGEGVVDFENYQNYSGTKPFFLSYFGNEISFNHSWGGVYVATAKCLYEDYPYIFKSLSDDIVSGKSPAIVVVATERDRFVRPVAFCDDFVLETNRSAENIIRNIKLLLEKCNVDYDNVVIRFANSKSVRVKIQPADSTTKGVEKTLRSVSDLDSTKKNDLIERISKIENTILQADIEGISYDDLQSRMKITMSEMKRLVAAGKHIVEIKGMLYHEDAFIDWNDGAAQVDAIIEKLMKKNNGYVSAVQLYNFAHAEMHMFLNDNDLDDERAVYEVAQHLFEKNAYCGKHYSFTGKTHISRSSQVRSNFDVFCKFAEDKGDIFRLADLEEYLTSVGIKIGNLRGQMRIYTDPSFLYYDEGILIYAKSMGINDAWKSKIRDALNKLFADVGDHIILRDVQPVWFGQLPELPGGMRWTQLLLQNILRYYSEELGARTIIAMNSQSIETLHTMLVRNDSPIRDFGDVVITVLLENETAARTFLAEELRQFLVDSHVIQGGELIGNMPKALGSDERFAWDAEKNIVTIRI